MRSNRRMSNSPAWRVLVFLGLLSFSYGTTRAAENSELPADAPENLRKNYVVAAGSVSPEGKYAAILPKGEYFVENEREAKNYLIELAPFRLLGAIATKRPTFTGQSHGGLSVLWRTDASAAIVTLQSKWGPGEIYVCLMAEGKIAQQIDLGAKVRALLLPALQRSKAVPFNDAYVFILESEYEPVTFSTTGTVIIDIVGNTNPKATPNTRSWKARLRAEFDPASGKFLRQKIDRSSAERGG